MVVHHRRYLRRTIVNQWSHEQRGSTKFLFPSYICPLPTLPSDHSSASCTRADVRICPAIHRLGQRMVKLKNLWRNLCPTAKIYRRFIRQDKNYLSSLAEFSNVRWIHRFRIAQFMVATFDRCLSSFSLFQVMRTMSYWSLPYFARLPISMSEQHRDIAIRIHIVYIIHVRERSVSRIGQCYIRHRTVRNRKKNQGARAKWKKKNRIIIHLVMFGQSFRPQQPS